MQETIDLIEHRALRELREFSKKTGQPTTLERLDVRPLEHFNNIEIDEEHVTIKYAEATKRNYNVNEITHREWSYKYNDDPEFVAAVARVIELARKHLRDLPNNVACPPGCGECCKSYEPFVSRADVQRIADHFGITYDEAMNDYVNPRPSADDFSVGWLKKTGPEITDPCVFLMGSRSGRHYCGIYEARPHDCADFTPIDCSDVDMSLPRRVKWPAYQPYRRKRSR